MKAAGFDARARTREGRWEDDRVGEGQGVGGVWLGGIDVDPMVTGKRRCIEPGAIGDKGIATQTSDGGLEMKASGYRYGDDLVIVRLEDSSELADAFGVTALAEADE